jgi:hypothetical protein
LGALPRGMQGEGRDQKGSMVLEQKEIVKERQKNSELTGKKQPPPPVLKPLLLLVAAVLLLPLSWLI